MRDRIDKYIKEWKRRGYSDDIPDEVPDALMDESLAPSYKAIAIAILRNDHHMTALGFQAPKSEWYGVIKRIEINQRNNKKMEERNETFVAYYGHENEWRLYRASDGVIVGYKSHVRTDGEKTAIERVVTNTNDPDKFHLFVDKRKPKAKRYNPYKDDSQQRIPMPE